MAPSTSTVYENENFCCIVPFSATLFLWPNYSGKYCKPRKNINYA
jgi:hypothetical protein